MTPKTKRTILLTVLGLIAIGAGVGYYLYNKPRLDPNDVSPKAKTTSIELYKEFAADSIKAKKTYSQRDEVIEVSGVVSSISQDPGKPPYILLKTNEEGAHVNCTMRGSVQNIKEGDTVNLKGICVGMSDGVPEMGILGDVNMTECYRMK